MYKHEYDLAIKAALKAGTLLENTNNVVVNSQAGKDIKLELDRKSEKIIVELLKETGIPILSEECGIIKGKEKDKLWIIDPLDGSANYWKRMKELTCVSIALWEKGEPILGVVYRFYQKEMFSGIVGVGAWLNGKSITTSLETEIKNAILATGFPVHRDYQKENLQVFIRQVQNFKKVRMLGAAAIMGVFVADGKIDAYIEEQIMLWDIAASSAIVKAAGGTIQIERMKNYQCVCGLFANNKLFTNYKYFMEN